MYHNNPLDKYSILEFLEIQEKGEVVLRKKWLPSFIARIFAIKEYYRLMDCYLNEIGLPTHYKEYLSWQQEYAYCMLEVMNGAIDMKVNAIHALNMAEKAMPTNEKKSPHLIITAILLKQIGIKVDLKNTTVREFYAILDYYKDTNGN